MKSNDSLFVYLVEAVGSGHYKIGVTGRLKDRISNLQTGSPFKIRLVHACKSSNAYQLERELHAKFSTYRAVGEWFALPFEAVKAVTVLLSLPSDVSRRSKAESELRERLKNRPVINPASTVNRKVRALRKEYFSLYSQEAALDEVLERMGEKLEATKQIGEQTVEALLSWLSANGLPCPENFITPLEPSLEPPLKPFVSENELMVAQYRNIYSECQTFSQVLDRMGTQLERRRLIEKRRVECFRLWLDANGLPYPGAEVSTENTLGDKQS